MMERRTIASGAAWEDIVGYSRAVRVGPFVFVSGTTASSPDGQAVGGDDVAAQTREILERIDKALLQAGAERADIVRTRIFLTDISRWEEAGRVHGEFFGDIRPTTSLVEVSALLGPHLLVEIEADAVVRT